MKSLLVLIQILASLNDLVRSSDKEIHFEAYTPLLYNGDLYGFRAALDTGLSFLREDQNILPGYNITIDYKDPERTAGIAGNHFLTTINNKSFAIQYVFGPYREKEDEIINYIADRYSIPKSSTKDNVEKSLLLAQVKLLKHFNWRRVGIMHFIGDGRKEENIREMKSQFVQNGIEVALERGFLITKGLFEGFEEGIPRREVVQFFDDFEKNDVRIIHVLGLDFSNLLELFCYASQRNFTSPKYQFIATDPSGTALFQNRWLVKRFRPCFRDAYERAKNLIRIIPRPMRNGDAKTSFNGRTVSEVFKAVDERHDVVFKKYEELIRRPVQKPPINLGSLYLVDQIYRVGLAYHTLLFESKKPSEEVLFTAQYNDPKKFSQIQNAIFKVEISGASGFYNLEKNLAGSQRDVSFQIWNGRTFVDIGSYNSESERVVIRSNNVLQLQGVTLQDLPLHDRILELVKLEVYKEAVLYFIWGLCILSIVVAIILFFLNNHYKNVKVLKMTSPSINNIMIFGAILCYVAILLYGIDGRHIFAQNITSMCMVSTIILTVGFTMTFGSLFGKTWRVYKIFTSSRHNKKMKLKDYHIFFFIIVLLFIDGILLTLWFVFSPYELVSRELEVKEDLGNDVIHKTIFHRCDCKYRIEFTIAIILVKAILMALGVFLSWETRNVTIPVLNDSRYLGASIYTVTIAALAGMITSMTLHHTNYYNEQYIILGLSVCIAMATTICMALVPKFLIMFGKNTLERRRTMSSNSLNIKNATDDILNARKERTDKLKTMHQDNVNMTTCTDQVGVSSAPVQPTQSQRAKSQEIKTTNGVNVIQIDENESVYVGYPKSLFLDQNPKSSNQIEQKEPYPSKENDSFCALEPNFEAAITTEIPPPYDESS